MLRHRQPNQAFSDLRPQKEHNTASNYKGLYGIFYKIFMEVVKVKILNKNCLPYSIRVLFAPGAINLPI